MYIALAVLVLGLLVWLITSGRASPETAGMSGRSCPRCNRADSGADHRCEICETALSTSAPSTTVPDAVDREVTGPSEPPSTSGAGGAGVVTSGALFGSLWPRDPAPGSTAGSLRSEQAEEFDDRFGADEGEKDRSPMADRDFKRTRTSATGNPPGLARGGCLENSARVAHGRTDFPREPGPASITAPIRRFTTAVFV